MSNLKLILGDDKSPFLIEGIMSAEFSWKDEIPKDMVEKLLKNNTNILLISYFRPVIANLTVQAGFPPFHLPFININDM